METKFVYMTTEQIEERRAKVAAIEGLAEIRAATAAWAKYHQAKARFENGEIDFEDVPAYIPNELIDLKKKYPRAAAYLEAEQWIYSQDPVKVRLAARALEKIISGEDPEAVLDEMRQGLDAFNMAQEG